MGNFAIEKYNCIKLNGISREGKRLEVFCEQELSKKEIPQWLADIYLFILQWLSKEEFITAHTSGSTGKPKPIKLQKKHMLASAQKTVDYFNLDSSKTALLCLSANYIAGKMMLIRAFVGGFNLFIAEPVGNPLKATSNIIDFAAMVPMQVYNSISDFSDTIKKVIIGGGAVSEELKKSLLQLPTQFYETYGMTETVSHVAIRKISEGETYFEAMPNVFFEQDERNCLQINAPDICSQLITTNDIVRLQNDRQFKFLGRYDNIINTGGIKIIPEEVEQKLAKAIHVPFLISSVPDEKLGEKIVLVLKEHDKIPSLNFSLLNKFEKPKEVIVIQQFPLTETGKIKRIEVKNMLKGI